MHYESHILSLHHISNKVNIGWEVLTFDVMHVTFSWVAYVIPLVWIVLTAALRHWDDSDCHASSVVRASFATMALPAFAALTHHTFLDFFDP